MSRSFGTRTVRSKELATSGQIAFFGRYRHVFEEAERLSKDLEQRERNIAEKAAREHPKPSLRPFGSCIQGFRPQTLECF